jgi:hypothetical protein
MTIKCGGPSLQVNSRNVWDCELFTSPSHLAQYNHALRVLHSYYAAAAESMPSDVHALLAHKRPALWYYRLSERYAPGAVVLRYLLLSFSIHVCFSRFFQQKRVPFFFFLVGICGLGTWYLL